MLIEDGPTEASRRPAFTRIVAWHILCEQIPQASAGLSAIWQEQTGPSQLCATKPKEPTFKEPIWADVGEQLFDPVPLVSHVWSSSCHGPQKLAL